MTRIIQDIPFLAEDTTWDNWNGSMLHYFGEEPLPYVTEDNWQAFANSMTLPQPVAFLYISMLPLGLDM